MKFSPKVLSVTGGAALLVLSDLSPGNKIESSTQENQSLVGVVNNHSRLSLMELIATYVPIESAEAAAYPAIYLTSGELTILGFAGYGAGHYAIQQTETGEIAITIPNQMDNWLYIAFNIAMEVEKIKQFFGVNDSGGEDGSPGDDEFNNFWDQIETATSTMGYLCHNIINHSLNPDEHKLNRNECGPCIAESNSAKKVVDQIISTAKSTFDIWLKSFIISQAKYDQFIKNLDGRRNAMKHDRADVMEACK